jgi:hypothetical protein
MPTAIAIGIGIGISQSGSGGGAAPPPSLALDNASPATGDIGAASANFTVTLSNGVADVVVTPASTNGSDVITPTTVTCTVASPVKTFTVTPATAGARTISVTNDSAITNPASVVYTANAMPAANKFFPLKTTIVATTGAEVLSFTRATVDNVVDFEGILRPVLSGEVPFTNARRGRNLVATTSETFTDASWTKTSCNVAGSVTDPLGGSTAFTVTGTGANWFLTQSILTSGISGDAAVTSVWARRRTGTGQIRIRAGSTSNLNITLTSSWQRVAAVGAYNSTSYTCAIGGATSGDEIDVWHMQGENICGQANTNPADYISVGVLSAPYHGANVDGVKYFATANGNTLASNVVTEATGAALTDTAASPIGFHCEPAATNICKRSETLENASWVSGGGGTTVTANTVAGPTGQVLAETLLAAGANATLIQDLGTIASAVKTFSIYLKRKTGTGNIDLTLDGGSTWTTKVITASWARYEITQTLADPDCGIRIVTSGDEVYAFGAQVEATAFATRYITTVAANVTRNADALTVPDTVYSDTAGTISAEVSCEVQASATAQRLFGPLLRLNAATIDAADGTNTPACTVAISDRKTLSTAWGSSTQRVAATGATAGTGSYDGGWGGSGTTPIGRSSSDTATVSIVLSNLKVWDTKLNATQQDLAVA